MKKLIIAGSALLWASSAFAHATIEQKEVKAGATTKITLRIPHGCKGEATHSVRLTLPDGFYAAKPMPKAGWELSTETGPYKKPFNNHGREMTEGLREVVWSGGNLESDWYDEFVVRGTFGKDLAPGTTLFFPAVQECANGTADWTDTSGSHDVPNPSPKVVLVAGEDGHDHSHGHGHSDKHQQAGGHDHSSHNHGGTPSHAAPEGFDQTALEGDEARIEGLLRATFETEDSNLSLAPTLVAGNHAMVGWVQDGRGGRAVLSKDDHGLWTLILCGGAAIKGKKAFEALGVPSGDAAHLAHMQEAEEAKLGHETIKLFDSFGETVRFD